MSLSESREISEWGAKLKRQWVGNLQGSQHLYPSAPGHLFSAALWRWSSSGTRRISCPGSLARWRRRQFFYHEQARKRATTADGGEEETHSGLLWMTRCQHFWKKTAELPYNYMRPSYFVFHPAWRILLRNLWGTRGTKREAPHQQGALASFWWGKSACAVLGSGVAGPLLAPSPADLKVAQTSPPCPAASFTTTHHSANTERIFESPAPSSLVLLMSRSKSEQRV